MSKTRYLTALTSFGLTPAMAGYAEFIADEGNPSEGNEILLFAILLVLVIVYTITATAFQKGTLWGIISIPVSAAIIWLAWTYWVVFSLIGFVLFLVFIVGISAPGGRRPERSRAGPAHLPKATLRTSASKLVKLVCQNFKLAVIRTRSFLMHWVSIRWTRPEITHQTIGKKTVLHKTYAMTPERRAQLAREFGNGIIVFGAKRPDSSAQKLVTEAQVPMAETISVLKTGYSLPSKEQLEEQAKRPVVWDSPPMRPCLTLRLSENDRLKRLSEMSAESLKVFGAGAQNPFSALVAWRLPTKVTCTWTGVSWQSSPVKMPNQWQVGVTPDARSPYTADAKEILAPVINLKSEHQMTNSIQSNDHPRPFAMVFALCLGAILQDLEKTFSPNQVQACGRLLLEVQENLQAILAGEIADNADDRLPGPQFLRHCATPLTQRYCKDFANAVRQKMGEESYQQLQQTLPLLVSG